MKEFFQAIRSGDLASVARMLADDPARANTRDQGGLSPFATAKYSQQEEIAALLLKKAGALDLFDACIAGQAMRVEQLLNADTTRLTQYSSDGWTALHLAAFFGQDATVELLLDRGADVHARSRNAMDNTALHAAAAGRKPSVIGILLDRGADVNARQHGGWTALHAASQNGDVSLMRLLLTHGADPAVRAANNQTPMDLAMTGGHQAAVDLLDGHQTRGHGAS